MTKAIFVLGQLILKLEKKTSRNDSKAQDDWIWIEFQNVRGNAGWLYGEADNIAFETQDNFIVVDRESLVNYVEEAVDMGKPVRKSFLAKYKTYRRAGRRFTYNGRTITNNSKL